MNKWIDLTVMIDESYKAFPGDEPIRFLQVASYEQDGYKMSQITTSMHQGTHMDAFSHILPVGDSIETVDVNRFIGEATVIRIKPEEGKIPLSTLKEQLLGTKPIVLFDFGWSRYLNQEAYYEYPKFELGTLELLKKHNVTVIGMDIPSPEYSEGEMLEMHRDLMTAGIYVIENLTNMNQLNRIVDFIGLPLKIKGLDGSMVRCVARNR